VEVIDFSDIINFDNYDQLLPLVANSIWAGALLALIGGLVGVFVMHRELAFAVHGISELSFAGAAVFLLIGLDVVFGSVFGSFIAAAIIAVLGEKARDRNSIVGVHRAGCTVSDLETSQLCIFGSGGCGSTRSQ